MNDPAMLCNVRLGDVIDIRDGTHDTPDYVEYGIPLITSKNLTDSGLSFRDANFISEDAHREVSKRSAVKKGDILFGMIGTIGKPTLVETEQQFSIKNMALFRQSNDRIDNRFVRWLLSSPTINRQLTQASKGGTQKFVSLGALRGLTATFPRLPVQRRIAAILDQADALRAKRREALAHLDTLTHSIFIEMFGDPATNPKSFPKRTLGEIIKFEGGSQPPASTFTSEETAETVRLVQIRDFKSDRFKTFIPRKLSRRYFEKDDVMIGRYGPPVFQILRGLSGSYNVALMKAVPRDGVKKDFVFHLLRERRLHNFVVANSERTAGQSGVNLELLEKYDAYLPPVAIQNAFTERVSTVDQVTQAMQVSLTELDTLFASLQHRAFRGEL